MIIIIITENFCLLFTSKFQFKVCQKYSCGFLLNNSIIKKNRIKSIHKIYEVVKSNETFLICKQRKYYKI